MVEDSTLTHYVCSGEQNGPLWVFRCSKASASDYRYREVVIHDGKGIKIRQLDRHR